MTKIKAFSFFSFSIFLCFQLSAQSNRLNRKYIDDNSRILQNVSTGYESSFQIRGGKLWAIGRNNSGQLGTGNLISQLTFLQVGSDSNWLAISQGQLHTIALKTDGTLWGWGDNRAGQIGLASNVVESLVPTQIGSDNSWTYINCGVAWTYAIKSDGTLWFWGFNGSAWVYTPTLFDSDNKWLSVKTGIVHTIGLKANGTIWGWGGNNYGQLGLGTGASTSVSSPTQILSGANWKEIGVGVGSSFALKSDGTLWAWGHNDNGQLGTGNNTNLNAPTQVGTENNWKHIFNYCNSLTTLALKGDGTLWGWGDNRSQQLGLGNLQYQNQPTQLNQDVNWVTASVGAMHCLIGDNQGKFYGLGANASNQLGLPNISNVTSITYVNTIINWQSIETEFDHTGAIKSDGTLWTWGRNEVYQCGRGGNPSEIQRAFTGNTRAVDMGNFHSIELRADGVIATCGVNSNGQLGYPGAPVGGNQQALFNVLTLLPNVSNVIHVEAGIYQSFLIKSDGTLWSWGFNASGQLGLGNRIDRSVPNQVGTDNKWVSVSSGSNHTLGLKSDGTLYAWGSNSGGQLGLGSSVSEVLVPVQVGVDNKWVSISAGYATSFGIKSDGTLWAWGHGQLGALGLGNFNNVFTPVQLGVEKKWIAVDAGQGHTVALKADGTLWTWGENDLGQLGYANAYTNHFSPTRVGNGTYVDATAGANHTFALSSSRTLFCFSGTNVQGQLGVGTFTQGQTILSCGQASTQCTISGFNPFSDTTRICGTNTTLSAGNSYSSYTWNTGASTSSLITSTGGVFRVVVSDANGCTASDSTFLSIVNANIVNTDTTVCKRGAVRLSIDSTFSNRYSITGGVVTLPALIWDQSQHSQLTIQAKVKCTSYTTNSGTVYRQVNGGEFGFEIQNQLFYFKLKASFGNCAASGGWVYLTYPITDNGWHTYSGTYDRVNGVAKLYVDGILRATSTINNGILASCTLYPNEISQLNNGLIIDEIFIHNYAWSAAQISSLNCSTTISNSPGLIAYWNFEERTGGIAYDLGPNLLSGTHSANYVPIGLCAQNLVSWSTGATSNSITVSPTQSTTYYVTVSDGVTSCIDSVRVNISDVDTSVTILDPPLVCSNSGQVRLQAGLASSYQWLRNGVAISGANTRLYTATQTGTYRVALVNSLGCRDTSRAIAVTLYPQPVSGFNVNPSIQCFTGNQFIFTNTTTLSAGTMTYLWDFGNGVTSTQQNPSYSYPAIGTYTVKLVATSSTGCKDSTTSTVNVNPSPTSTFQVNNLNQCLTGNNFVFTNSSTISPGALTYQWTFGDGNTTTNTSPSHTYAAAGTYTVKLVASSGQGCKDSTTRTVTVYPTPSGILNTPSTNLLCEGGVVILTATGGTSYQWFLNGGAIAGAINSTLSANQPGVYTVNVTSSNGCTSNATGSITLQLISKPTANFDYSNYCATFPTQFSNQSTVTNSGVVNYSWNFGQGQGSSTIQNPSYTYPTTGTYSASLTVTPVACPSLSSTVTKPITTVAPPTNQRYTTLNAVQNRDLQLEARAFGAAVYSWSPTSGLNNASIFNPVFNYNNQVEYLITITTPIGCVVMDTQLVRIYKEKEIYVPKGFSPNGDGSNDKIFPRLVGIRTLLYFKIYDRWGQLLYQTSNANEGWDGKYRGAKQPIDTYVWLAEGIDIDNNNLKRTGTFLLFR